VRFVTQTARQIDVFAPRSGMRFVSIFVCILFGCFQLAVASPIQRQANSTDAPMAPDGFVVEKMDRNFGAISAMAVSGNDLYYIDQNGKNVIKLSDRNGDQKFDTRSVYLIGFDGLTDIVSNKNQLYISDKNAIWQVAAERTLVASARPNRLTSIAKFPARLAIDYSKDRLYIGSPGHIKMIDLKSGTASTVLTGQWVPTALAVSPNSGLWAAFETKVSKYVAPVRTASDTPARLDYPVTSRVTDLYFWRQDTYPKKWPNVWQNSLLIALKGDEPMIARAEFTFGDIGSELAPFITAFSEPSRVIGRREVWGYPSSLEALADGRLLFAEPQSQSLRTLAKSAEHIVKTPIDSAEDSEQGDVKKKKPEKPTLIRGSNIENVSGILRGSALEHDPLLKRTEIKEGLEEPKNQKRAE